jgi:hypothetical protein
MNRAVRNKVLLLTCRPDAPVELTGRSHSIRLRLRDFLDERHVSRFESHSFDCNGHLNVHFHTLE